MNLIDRAKNILLTPKTEWDVIAAEATPRKQLILGYVLPLASLAAVAGFIGGFLAFSMGGMGGAYLVWGLLGLVLRIAMAVAAAFVVAFLIDALAPKFGGQPDFAQALKVAVYSLTAAWVAGVLAIIPWAGALLALLGSLYGLYLLYLGLPKLMKSPPEKSLAYTAVVIVATIVVMAILNALVAALSMPESMSGGMMSGYGGATERRPGTLMGKRPDIAVKPAEPPGKAVEAPVKPAEAPVKAAEAPAKKMMPPMAADAMREFLPAAFAGLPRTSQATERGNIAAFVVSTARASYGDARGRSVRLEITDSGGAAGAQALVAWAGAAAGEADDGKAIERTRREAGRIVHEKTSKSGGENEYGLVLGERFVVRAVGSVDLALLKAGVSGIDLARLESAGSAKN